MTELVVESCGPAASLQDRGRFGFQRYGVSPAGAMDIESLAVANALVGNRPDEAAIEFALVGGTLRLDGGPALIALAGPGSALSVAGRAVPPLTSVHTQPGETLIVGPVRGGVYAYLAVAGGFRLAPDMGSRSVHRRSGLGGRPLAPGDRLPCGAPAGRQAMRLRRPEPAPEGAIRVLLGPQDDHFRPEAIETLLGSEYRVSAQADRMGVRVDGPPLAHAGDYNIVSDGIVAGHIQVPGHGRPVVLLHDRQTTGGYPKIATVISADLARFAQMPPGCLLRFRLASRDEALAVLREQRRRIAALPDLLGRAEEPVSTERLLAANLISGVADGRA